MLGAACREFSPTGIVLDRNGPVLFSDPERHFRQLAVLLRGPRKF